MFFFIQAGISTGCVGENRWNLPGAAVFFGGFDPSEQNPRWISGNNKKNINDF